MLQEHFTSVQGLVYSPLQQPSVIAGQMAGVRKRVYKILKSNFNDLPLEVANALEAIYTKPLTAEAEGRLRKALTARTDEDLGSLIAALHTDSRLVLDESPSQDPIRIVC